MKKLVILSLSLLLSACAALKPGLSTVAEDAPATKTVKRSKSLGKTRAIFHVIEPVGMELIVFHVDERKEERLLMDKMLSQIGMLPGHWQVKGFILNGERFEFMNDGQQFVFTLKPGKSSYVGSYIVQCPRVGQNHQSKLKRMSFFNRYPFRSDRKLCEMVVGSDFDNVKRVWAQLNPAKQMRLSIGF